MEGFLSFMIRASVYLLLFGAGYYLLFRKYSTTTFQRFYILLSFVLSMILATVGRVEMGMSSSGNAPIALIQLPEILVSANSGYMEVTRSWAGWGSAPWILIPMVAGLFFGLLFALRVVKIAHLIRKHPAQRLDNVRLVSLPNLQSPFSFFQWIFIPTGLRHTTHFEKVIAHEMAHCRNRHSWDIVFLEIMRMLFWFHPAWYFYKREMQNIHEYEADMQALKVVPKLEYQNALLAFAFQTEYRLLTNPFNCSTLKKRLMMMNQNRSNSNHHWWKLFLLVPFLSAAFFIQSCDMQEEPIAQEQAEEETRTDVSKTTSDKATDDDEIFTMVDQQPEYPGGVNAMMKFLSDNLQYPEDARENNIAGTVFISFVVEKNGEISNVRILRGLYKSLDEEALRVVKMMPVWSPGLLKGEPVRVQFNLPIRFMMD